MMVVQVQRPGTTEDSCWTNPLLRKASEYERIADKNKVSYQIWRESDAVSYFWEATVLYADLHLHRVRASTSRDKYPQKPWWKAVDLFTWGFCSEASIQIVRWDYLQLLGILLIILIIQDSHSQNNSRFMSKTHTTQLSQELRPKLADIAKESSWTIKQKSTQKVTASCQVLEANSMCPWQPQHTITTIHQHHPPTPSTNTTEPSNLRSAPLCRGLWRLAT